ncbi:hypothetical protein IKG16_02275 [Candidatus Saccharibacteria bacterium]|nr:hypothetical protein [Candidatus Saccharibacteria bacterium]
MEELDIKSLVRYIGSKFYIVLAAIILAVTAGEFYTFSLQTPLYKSTTQLVLLKDADSSSSQITVSDVQVSNNLVNTYSEILKSNNVLDQVAKEMGGSYTAAGIRNNLTTTITTGTQLISVSVSDKSAENAQKIAGLIANTFKQEIKNIYNIDNVQIVDKANLPTSAYNVNVLKQTIYYLLAGLALGLGATIAMYYLDTSIKDTSVIEDKFKLVVMGTIPNMEKK